jgi:hypothetical protein
LTQRAIDLHRMSEKEYANYMEAHLEAYAQVRARAFKSSKDEELAVAKKQVRGLLKDGVKTKGHYIYVAVDSATGESVGNLWVHVEQDKKRAFLLQRMSSRSLCLRRPSRYCALRLMPAPFPPRRKSPPPSPLPVTRPMRVAPPPPRPRDERRRPRGRRTA